MGSSEAHRPHARFAVRVSLFPYPTPESIAFRVARPFHSNAADFLTSSTTSPHLGSVVVQLSVRVRRSCPSPHAKAPTRRGGERAGVEELPPPLRRPPTTGRDRAMRNAGLEDAEGARLLGGRRRGRGGEGGGCGGRRRGGRSKGGLAGGERGTTATTSKRGARNACGRDKKKW